MNVVGSNLICGCLQWELGFYIIIIIIYTWTLFLFTFFGIIDLVLEFICQIIISSREQKASDVLLKCLYFFLYFIEVWY